MGGWECKRCSATTVPCFWLGRPPKPHPPEPSRPAASPPAGLVSVMEGPFLTTTTTTTTSAFDSALVSTLEAAAGNTEPGTDSRGSSPTQVGQQRRQRPNRQSHHQRQLVVGAVSYVGCRLERVVGLPLAATAAEAAALALAGGAVAAVAGGDAAAGGGGSSSGGSSSGVTVLPRDPACGDYDGYGSRSSSNSSSSSSSSSSGSSSSDACIPDPSGGVLHYERWAAEGPVAAALLPHPIRSSGSGIGSSESASAGSGAAAVLEAPPLAMPPPAVPVLLVAEAPLLVSFTDTLYGVRQEVEEACVRAYGAAVCVVQAEARLELAAAAAAAAVAASGSQRVGGLAALTGIDQEVAAAAVARLLAAGDDTGSSSDDAGSSSSNPLLPLPPPPPAAAAAGSSCPSNGGLSAGAGAGIGVAATLGAVLCVLGLSRWIGSLRAGHRTLTLAVRPPGATPATTLLITDIMNSTNLWEALPPGVSQEGDWSGFGGQECVCVFSCVMPVCVCGPSGPAVQGLAGAPSRSSPPPCYPVPFFDHLCNPPLLCTFVPGYDFIS